MGIILSLKQKVFLGLIVLAYGLGLRHAVDADHIAVIDNTTRKLMQEGKRPVAVGFFFSLGHSTIVILLSILAAVSAAFVKNHLPEVQHVGTVIGTAISSGFLLMIGIINLLVLIDIVKIWKSVTSGGEYDEVELYEYLNNRGLVARILKPFLRSVTSSWHMYTVGLLFGLGFDTASEVALLSISAATGANGLPFIAILVLPLAFTAGMSLIDTLDGILMLGAYGWAYFKPIRKLYYNMNITFLSVVIALFIGGIEGIQVLSIEFKLNGRFFEIVKNIDFANLGYIIIGTFIASWLFSLMYYKYKKYDYIDAKKAKYKRKK